MPRSPASCCCYPRHTTAWSFPPFLFSPLAASLCLLPNTHTQNAHWSSSALLRHCFHLQINMHFPFSQPHTHTTMPLLTACPYLHLSCIHTYCLTEHCLSSICLSGAFLPMLQLVEKASCFSASLSAKDIQTKKRKTF